MEPVLIVPCAIALAARFRAKGLNGLQFLGCSDRVDVVGRNDHVVAIEITSVIVIANQLRQGGPHHYPDPGDFESRVPTIYDRGA